MHNSLELSFTNIWGLRLNFVDCEFFLDSNSPDILALCETNLDDSTDSGNFSVRGYLPLISNDSSTRAWSRSLCKRRTSFARDWSLENSADSYLCFNWLYFTQCLTSFSSIDHLILSNIDKVLLINPSANVFVFGDFNINHKEWLPCSGGIDRSGELCYQTTLLRWSSFLLRFQTVILSLTLLDLVLSSDAIICSTIAFPPLGNSDHVVVSVFINFPLYS